MMDNEQNQIVKSMRNAIKNGNLDMVTELLRNNEGLLEVNTVFGLWLHIAASYGRIDIAKYDSIGELEKVDACEYAKQHGQTEIEIYLRRNI